MSMYWLAFPRKQHYLFLLSLLILFVGATLSHATILHVPSQYSTIEDAVDAASNRDTILVDRGTYVGLHYIGDSESPSFITLMGLGWPNGTNIIQVPGYPEAIYLKNVLGWRVTNLEVSQTRIGIRVDSVTSMEIDNNYIHDVSGSGYPYPIGIILRYYTRKVSVHHNLITDNEYAGMLIRYNTHHGIHIYNNTIEYIHWYEGIQFCEMIPEACVVTNNIIINCGGQGVEFAYGNQGNTEVSYNCIFQTSGPWQNVPNPGPDNIFVSPQFTLQSTIPEYYYLSENSPCIDTGNPSSFYNDPNGTRSDMGAFPYDYCLVDLVIDWVDAFPGDTVDVPINISEVTGLDLLSSELVITYPDDDLELLEMTIPPESLPYQAGWTINYSAMNGVIMANIGDHVSLSGSGLFAVMTYVLGDDVLPNSAWNVRFQSALFNNGAMAPNTVDGGVRLPGGIVFGDVDLNGHVTLMDASLLFSYLTGIEPLTQYQQFVAEVSGMEDITPFDGALITQHCFGQFELFPVEGGIVETYVEGTMTIPELSVMAGEELEVPIQLQNGINVGAGWLELTLGGELVELLEIRGPDQGAWFSRYSGSYPDYTIYLGGSEPLNGNQDFFYLTFQVPDTADGVFSIQLANIMLNETEMPYQVNCEITITGSSVPGGETMIPETFSFDPAYPNPFNPITNLVFSIPEPSQVNLKIYNTLGQVIDVLESRRLPPGYYTRIWDATQFATGIYFAELNTGSYHRIQKLILMK